MIEIKSFFVFFFILERNDKLEYNRYRHFHEFTYNIFSAMMSKSCFKFLEQFIQFDNKNAQPERWRGDKYAALREFFESVNVQNASMRGP